MQPYGHAGMLYACKGVHTLLVGQREKEREIKWERGGKRERERERGKREKERERQREREKGREMMAAFRKNDGCLGTF
jgi:hypothetical protein